MVGGEYPKMYQNEQDKTLNRETDTRIWLPYHLWQIHGQPERLSVEIADCHIIWGASMVS